TDLVQFVERDQRVVVLRRLNPGGVQEAGQHAAMIQPDGETFEAETRENVAHRREYFCFNQRRVGTHRIDVALIELPKPSARWTIGAPYRLDLITLPEFRKSI